MTLLIASLLTANKLKLWLTAPLLPLANFWGGPIWSEGLMAGIKSQGWPQNRHEHGFKWWLTWPNKCGGFVRLRPIANSILGVHCKQNIEQVVYLNMSFSLRPCSAVRYIVNSEINNFNSLKITAKTKGGTSFPE